MTSLDPEKQIGRQVRELRIQLGWSQQRLADQMKALGGRYANWRQGMIDKTERGTRPLRVNEVTDLAAVLGVPPEILLGPLLPGLDAGALDAQIAETEARLRAAEKKYDMAYGQLRNAKVEHASLETLEREAFGQMTLQRATLDALRRARKQAEPEAGG